MSGRWPWRNDTKDDRYRRIIELYRSALMRADPESCLSLDSRLADYGQGWVSDDTIVDVNEMMTAKALAERHGLSEWDIRNWERAGHIQGFRRPGISRVLFRQGDVLAYVANRRRR